MRACSSRGGPLAKHLPQLDRTRVRSVVRLAKALVYAASVVPARGVSDREFELRVKRLAPLREELLANADALARRGLLPEPVVRALREGTGVVDMAKDALALSGLYEQHAAAVAGKHPTSAAEFAQVRADAQWLLERVDTSAAGEKLGTAGPLPEAQERDALYALLVRYYDELLRIAGYFAPGAVESLVPPLHSQSTGRLASAPAEPPAPAPAPEPAPAPDAGAKK